MGREIMPVGDTVTDTENGDKYNSILQTALKLYVYPLQWLVSSRGKHLYSEGHELVTVSDMNIY